MTIATVVTLGYGSFGSVNAVVTLGYSIGEAEVSSLVRITTKSGDLMSVRANSGDLMSVATKSGGLLSIRTG
jgi:hypothetical protein